MTTAKPKYNAAEIPQSSGGLNHPMKMVKMIQARCRICNHVGKGKRGWWDECPHDPYYSMQPIGPPVPKYQEHEDGTFTETGEVEPPKFVRRPNWKQIADDHKVTSGRMVQIQRERGSKFPPELGYPPICDYYNCWEVNPSIHANRLIAADETDVRIRVGDYHAQEEAQIMTLRLSGTPIYLGITDGVRRAEQISKVAI